MDREKLIEQAREYIANTLRDVPMNYNGDELTFYATFASDFAAKIRDEAVAAERKRIAEMVREIVAESNGGLIADAELMAVSLEQSQPSPDTPE